MGRYTANPRLALALAVLALAGAFLMLAGAPVRADTPKADAAPAATPAPAGFDATQKQAIEQIVRDYLLANPEVLRDALIELGSREKAAAEDQRKQRIADLRAELEREPDDPVLGNPDGAITIVEFFDYQCGYCKAMKPVMQNILASEKDVRVVMKEFPILSAVSVTAARAALAAREQGKYQAMHDRLMGYRGRLSDEAVFAIAGEAGLDIERLKADMQAPAVAAVLERNQQLAERLEISGTPSFIVGETLVPGAVNEEGLRKLIAETRAKL
ncbi:DsbA family protein [Oceanibaculum indicum]|nr:DsbA family protein [Oceanibaculum indicum]RKQ73766.1 protein-disulfide isomerase [Oceanibaculum indicum]